MGGFLLVVAVGVAGAEILHLVGALRFNRNAVRAEASLEGIEQNEIETGPPPRADRPGAGAWSTRTSLELVCRIEFTTERGRRVQASLPCDTEIFRFEEGRLPVLYDPADPRHVRSSPYALLWVEFLASAAFAAVCALAGCRVLSVRPFPGKGRDRIRSGPGGGQAG